MWGHLAIVYIFTRSFSSQGSVHSAGKEATFETDHLELTGVGEVTPPIESCHIPERRSMSKTATSTWKNTLHTALTKFNTIYT